MKKTAKTRNGNSMTEAAYWGSVRAILRRGFRYWKPMQNCKTKARRPSESDNKRLKYEYQCNHCDEWYSDKNVQIDHITPVGSLKCADDLVGFLERLTAEDGFQMLCIECHQKKSNKERGEKK